MSKSGEFTAYEVVIENYSHIVSFNQKFLSNFIFRGQSDSEWGLAPSLERIIHLHHPKYIDKSIPNIYEKRTLDTFKYKYPLYAANVYPKEDDDIEWLTLMQHYGAPTRLLDFSNSIFVALYMALDGSFSENSVIWAVNKTAMYSKHVERYCKENNTSSVSNQILDKYVHDKANLIIGNDSSDREILTIHPYLCNERVAIQQGLFLMASDITIPFIDVFNSFFQIEDHNIKRIPIKCLLDYSYSKNKDMNCRDVVLFRIVIPKKFKWELTQLLNQMNITAETLYPGLSGLAKSLSALQLRDPQIYSE